MHSRASSASSCRCACGVIFLIFSKSQNTENALDRKGTNALISLLVAVVTCYVLIIYCAIRIVLRMRSADFMESRGREMQRQLFRALLLQTGIPLVISYLPVAMIYILALLGVDGGELSHECVRKVRKFSIFRKVESVTDSLGELLMFSTALFPVIDPLVILFCLHQYRRTLFAALRRLPGSGAVGGGERFVFRRRSACSARCDSVQWRNNGKHKCER